MTDIRGTSSNENLSRNSHSKSSVLARLSCFFHREATRFSSPRCHRWPRQSRQCNGFLFLKNNLCTCALSLSISPLLTPANTPTDSPRFPFHRKLIPPGHSSSEETLRGLQTATVHTVICQVSARRRSSDPAWPRGGDRTLNKWLLSHEGRQHLMSLSWRLARSVSSCRAALGQKLYTLSQPPSANCYIIKGQISLAARLSMCK